MVCRPKSRVLHSSHADYAFSMSVDNNYRPPPNHEDYIIEIAELTVIGAFHSLDQTDSVPQQLSEMLVACQPI